MAQRDRNDFDPGEVGPEAGEDFTQDAPQAFEPPETRTEIQAELERQLAESRDKYLRQAAEYDNYRKRTMKERSELAPRAQAEIIKQLLDPLDDLSRFAHVDPATVDAATIVQGADMVEKKLQKVLTAAGLEIIDPANQTFDPQLHEAVATEPALSAEDDHVVARVFQVGYKFNGQLLRPARVVVNQWNG
jgi:molecular chaperone GrpE